MPEKYLFEYAVIRVVPRVEREEFFNVGVILYCKELNFLQVLYSVDRRKLRALCAELDCSEVAEHLEAFKKICNGEPSGGPIARLDLPSRFRWLTATRSTILQASKVHPGFCHDPELMLQRLHRQLVL